MLENGGQNVEIGDPTLENRSLALENGSRRVENGIRKPVSTEGAASIRRPAPEDSDGPRAQYMYISAPCLPAHQCVLEGGAVILELCRVFRCCDFQ